MSAALEAGVAAFNAGRFQDALAHFRRARRGPSAAQAGCLEGHCLASLGRLSEAEAAFRAAARRSPTDARALVGLSELLRRAGRLPDAEAAAREAVARAAGTPAAKRALDEALRSRRLAASAAAAPRPSRAPQAPRRRPPRRSLLESARAQETLGRFADAQRLYERELARAPGSRAALAGLSHVLAAQGRGAHALRRLRQAAAAPDGGGPDAERFKTAMRAGDYDAAFAAAERLCAGPLSPAELRGFWNPWQWDSVPDPRPFRSFHKARLDAWTSRHPRSPWGYFYRGALTPGPERLRDFERALRAGRGQARYRWMALKAGWACLGQSPRAVTLLSRAAAARPRDWWALGFLAEALLLARRPRRAAAAADRAVAEAGREKPSALAWRGELKLWRGDYAGALQDLRRARAGALPFSRTWEAAALYKLGRAQEALAVLDQTLARYPRDAEAYVWRGEVQRALGRPREALQDLSRAPVPFWARVNRALAYGALGRERELRADVAAVAAALGASRGRALLAAARRPGGAAPLLEALLQRARGYRRDDYVRSSWLAGR